MLASVAPFPHPSVLQLEEELWSLLVSLLTVHLSKMPHMTINGMFNTFSRSEAIRKWWIIVASSLQRRQEVIDGE